MALQTNPQLELAYEYVCGTNQSIYLTGKAGTGKTTFLHRIKREADKRMVVVAPTGVAAINAGGMTIHSFFQLPFGLYLPGMAREAARQRRMSGKKIDLIRSLELLVIDEISMVRADVLDGIDEVLRRFKNPLHPFGGVQLLMIGDLHQLPPVVKGQEQDLLQQHYDTPYFFSSKALQKTRPVVVELTHIFRQSDDTFIKLLNKVRENKIDQEVLDTLNSRYLPNGRIRDEDAYITLTTHNRSARQLNAQKLEGLPGQGSKFTARVEGDFPEHAYPADEVLELKVGAQVMFIKNDLSGERRYYNGKIGKVTAIKEDAICVQCPGDESTIEVGLADWENTKYALDEQTKEVSEKIVGTFTQYPLRHAWAVTIHKSQGLTFERVVLDAQAAFAHGQVYVALSRCKSFEGIVLRSKITSSSVRTDMRVQRYSQAAEQNAPGEEDLEQAKIAHQQALIRELFGFKTLQGVLEKLNRLFLEHEHNLNPDAFRQFKELAVQVENELLPVSRKFQGQLQRYFADCGLPEESAELQERIQKGSGWFSKKIAGQLQPLAKDIAVVTDNKKVREALEKGLEDLRKELFVKQAGLQAVQEGFSTTAYRRTKARAELDFQSADKASPSKASKGSDLRNLPHRPLFDRLRAWRQETADDMDVPAYVVLPNRTIFHLLDVLPATFDGLKNIDGIGKSRIDKYGAELLDMIRQYREAHDIPEPEPELIPPPKPKSREVSLELFRSGKTIAEVAEERELAVTTVEGHLSHFVGQGELDIHTLMAAEAVQKIEAYLDAHPEATLSEVKAHFGEEHSYGALRMVRAYWREKGESS